VHFRQGKAREKSVLELCVGRRVFFSENALSVVQTGTNRSLQKKGIISKRAGKDRGRVELGERRAKNRTVIARARKTHSLTQRDRIVVREKRGCPRALRYGETQLGEKLGAQKTTLPGDPKGRRWGVADTVATDLVRRAPRKQKKRSKF